MANNQPEILPLYVQSSAECLEFTRYLNKLIDDFNKNGIYFEIHLVEKPKKKLPIIVSNGKRIYGVDNIIMFLSNQMKNPSGSSRSTTKSLEDEDIEREESLDNYIADAITTKDDEDDKEKSNNPAWMSRMNQELNRRKLPLPKFSRQHQTEGSVDYTSSPAMSDDSLQQGNSTTQIPSQRNPQLKSLPSQSMNSSLQQSSGGRRPPPIRMHATSETEEEPDSASQKETEALRARAEGLTTDDILQEHTRKRVDGDATEDDVMRKLREGMTNPIF